MRFSRSLLFGAAVALIGAGCEVHEPDHEAVGVGVSANVAVDEPQGAVIEGPGVEAIDVEPDPSARVYIYDEGYPPGTYTYNGYYYYGGYRYPRDVFVNRYVQENIRQHRFANKEDNHRQAQAIEQRHRTEFTKTHGVRQNRPEQRSPQPNVQTPARQPEAPRPNVERPENRPPAVQQRPAVEEPRPNVGRPENKAPVNEERRPALEQRENKTSANEEHRANVAHPENKESPANAPRQPNREEPKREEQK